MFESYLRLALVSLLPVVLSVVFYYLNKATGKGKAQYIIKQIIFGLGFGALAIIGTEYGIPMNGAMVNCRDGAVLSGGLLFGAPTGIIAGTIGGIERLITKSGDFTRIACSLSTFIAGLYSAALRKFMFEDKKPSWSLALAIGVVMEVFHLTMVFITNMSEPSKAMDVVKACSIPMITANGLAVMFSALAVSLVSKEILRPKQSKVRISQTIQRWLLFTVLIAFFSTSYFVIKLQNEIAVRQTDSLLEHALNGISRDIEDVSGGDVTGIAKNRDVAETGFIIIANDEGQAVSISSEEDTEELRNEISNLNFENFPNQDTTFILTINGNTSYCRYRVTEGYYVISVLPEAEAMQMRNVALYVNSFMEVLVFAVLFALIYILIKKVVVNKIKTINNSLAKITEGDLGVVVDVRTNEEFASLSDDINSTVDTLKRYIDEATKRIDAELEFAKSIQSSALPNVFPAFPKRKEFDIFALMDPAKEVGGDFYDFYITGEDTLNFLIADVSGKGIPAAMFMMRAKTELKTLTESDIELSEVFTRGNNALTEGNDAGMFVTAWQGSLNLATGVLTYANAGHNPPLVRHNDGEFEYLKTGAGFILAGMDGVKYKTHEFKLKADDVIYMYTDGVTEATNKNNELYGEERLLKTVNKNKNLSVKEICENVKKDVEEFVGEAPQFDDITMVALKFMGKNYVPSISFENADFCDICAVTEFVESELSKIDCPMKTVMQINVAIDEIYSNIVRYAYNNEKGLAKVSVDCNNPGVVVIKFTDEGVPYNPLKKEDPNVNLSADDRDIGGLGIYIVKKTMDNVEYAYEDNKNVLTITKKF